MGAVPLHGDDRLLMVRLEHRDERRDRDPQVIRLGHDPGTVDSIMAIEGRLDLSQLDPVAALFDHAIASAVKHVTRRSRHR